eukprot:scaffold2036_cov256-Pinguiococcus_pyrenoidosus.AAC.7
MGFTSRTYVARAGKLEALGESFGISRCDLLVAFRMLNGALRLQEGAALPKPPCEERVHPGVFRCALRAFALTFPGADYDGLRRGGLGIHAKHSTAPEDILWRAAVSPVLQGVGKRGVIHTLNRDAAALHHQLLHLAEGDVLAHYLGCVSVHLRFVLVGIEERGQHIPEVAEFHTGPSFCNSRHHVLQGDVSHHAVEDPLNKEQNYALHLHGNLPLGAPAAVEVLPNVLHPKPQQLVQHAEPEAFAFCCCRLVLLRLLWWIRGHDVFPWVQ